MSKIHLFAILALILVAITTIIFLLPQVKRQESQQKLIQKRMQPMTVVGMTKEASAQLVLMQDRLTQFDELNRQSFNKGIYGSIQQTNETVDVFVLDSWRKLPEDVRQLKTEKMFSLWCGMGSARQILEDYDSVRMRIILRTGKVVGHMDSIRGYREDFK
jgi:hypothetical protein